MKVEGDLTGRITTGCYTGDKRPIIQLAFKDRIVGYQAINYYLSFILPFLSKIRLYALQRRGPLPGLALRGRYRNALCQAENFT